jgi:formylglycine-generating enzyme required for sulfatase activity
MSSKNKKGEIPSNKKEISKDKDSISFKPIGGIRPGVYLFAGYAAVLLLILFFLLVFPGLRNPYSRVSFASEPWGTAVRMDDVYIGTTPFTFDVQEGAHRFTFVLPGFDEKNLDADIKARFFASLLFPKKMKIQETMKTNDPVNAFVLGAQSFSQWSFAGESTAVFQHPMDLSAAAYRIGFVENQYDRTNIQEILKASARFAATKTAARDIIRSKMIIDNAGKALSPLSAITSIKNIAEYLSEAEGASFLLTSLLPEEHVSAMIGSAWYAEESGKNSEKTAFTIYEESVLNVKNLSFWKIPANNVQFYRERFSNDFWIAENYITKTDWNAFVSENPQWSADNIDSLIAEGLVGDAYLLKIDDSRYPEPAVPGISWFAAKAYCDWLESSLNNSAEYQGNGVTYEVRLPTEIEWEYAAFYNGRSLANTADSFWEWCEDPFVPLNNFPASSEAINLVSSPKRSLRGGASWFDSRSSSLQTRGSLEPNSSSPFVSFRPIILVNDRNN